MKQIIIGTRNKAKLKQIQGALAPLQISVLGLPNVELPEIKEDGKTAQENAEKKAVAYAKALGQPVLSMDNALYLKGLPDKQQPGINVRRIEGRTDRPTDEELLVYYSKVIEGLGGQARGHWEFALCLAKPNGAIKKTTILSPRMFTSKRSQKSIEGYPLEALQIDPKANKYVSEMSQKEQDAFWQEAIGRQLCEFVKNAL